MAILNSEDVKAVIRREAEKQGVDPNVALSIFAAENGSLRDGKLAVNPQVDTQTQSPVGAMGLMQVMPATFRGLVEKGFLAPTTDYSTPQGQIQAGVAAIKERMEAGITDPTDLAISYNASPTVFKQYKTSGVLPPETTEYVKKFSNAFGGSVQNMHSSSSRQSTSKQVVPPEVQAGVIESQGRFTGLLDVILPQLKDLGVQFGVNAKQQQDATLSGGEAAAQSVLAKGRIDTEQVQSRNETLSAFGVNLNDADPQIVRSMQIADRAMQARQPLERELAALTGVNPLEDPAGWLIGNFKALGVREKYNALVRQENSAVEDIKTRQALAANQAAIQPAKVTQDLQLKALADADLARYQAQAQAAQIGSVALQGVSRSLTEQLNGAQADLSSRLAVAKLLTERISQSMSTSEREQFLKEQDDITHMVNAFTAGVGLGKFTPQGLKYLPKQTRESLIEAAQTGRWGSDTGSAITLLHEVVGDAGVQRLVQTQPVLGNFLKTAIKNGNAEVQAAFHKEQTSGLPDPELKAAKSDEDRLALGIRRWQAKMQAEVANGDFSRLSKDNPARLDISSAVVIDELKNNSIVGFLKEYNKDGKTTASLDDNLLWNGAISRVANHPQDLGKVAKDLSDFYRVGMGHQVADVGLSQFGISVQPGYPVRRFNTPVNMMSPAQVEAMLVKEVAQQKMQDAYTSGGLLSNLMGGK